MTEEITLREGEEELVVKTAKDGQTVELGILLERDGKNFFRPIVRFRPPEEKSLDLLPALRSLIAKCLGDEEGEPPSGR